MEPQAAPLWGGGDEETVPAQYGPATDDVIPAYYGPSEDVIPASYGPSEDEMPARFGPSEDVIPASYGPSEDVIPARFGPSEGEMPARFGPSEDVIPASYGPSEDVIPAQHRMQPQAAPLWGDGETVAAQYEPRVGGGVGRPVEAAIPAEAAYEPGVMRAMSGTDPFGTTMPAQTAAYTEAVPASAGVPRGGVSPEYTEAVRAGTGVPLGGEAAVAGTPAYTQAVPASSGVPVANAEYTEGVRASSGVPVAGSPAYTEAVQAGGAASPGFTEGVRASSGVPVAGSPAYTEGVQARAGEFTQAVPASGAASAGVPAGSPEFTQAVPASGAASAGVPAGSPEFTRAVPKSAGVPLDGTVPAERAESPDGMTAALKVGGQGTPAMQARSTGTPSPSVGSAKAGGFLIVPEQLRAASGPVLGVADDLKELFTSMNAYLSGMRGNSPWGNDDDGKSFANGEDGEPGYLANEKDVLEGLEALPQILETIGKRLKGMADGYENTEQFNLSGMGKPELPLPGTGQQDLLHRDIAAGKYNGRH
ncbi:hypothetical protein ACIA8O_05655 [Kitasatospora sp. NPDC051853]|uniref:hypothetical protein n=1 Tax=Kitasatospora sp. NPDC051853 TaxID=3364058 RepID=UPI00379C8E8B